ncbi:MAG: ribosome recycling factor [Ruminococcus sp.]|nr:ribosome recycling factor [Ruminococcus sp.]
MKELMKEIEEKMKKTLGRLEHEFTTIRAGRANPAVLDKVQVDYYGVPTPVQQMAAISVAEARILVIQPWDVTTLKAIEKAILASDVGITPTNDGKVLRLVFPQLTEDRRKELCKNVKKLGEDAKVAVRNIRRETIDKLKAKKKASELTEDDVKDGEKQVQKLTDRYVADIDKAVAKKDKEIMSI